MHGWTHTSDGVGTRSLPTLARSLTPSPATAIDATIVMLSPHPHLRLSSLRVRPTYCCSHCYQCESKPCQDYTCLGSLVTGSRPGALQTTFDINYLSHHPSPPITPCLNQCCTTGGTVGIARALLTKAKRNCCLLIHSSRATHALSYLRFRSPPRRSTH